MPDRHYPVEHTAGGETSLLLAIHPDLVALDKTFESDRSLRSNYAEEPGHLRRHSESPHKYIGVNPAVTDLSNDPEGATVERGRALLETIVECVAARARTVLAETTSSDQYGLSTSPSASDGHGSFPTQRDGWATFPRLGVQCPYER